MKNKHNLLYKSIAGLAALFIDFGVVLFGVAWTFDYWQAWAYIIIFITSCTLVTIYLWKNDTKLLERRVKAGPISEKQIYQKVIQYIACFAFIGIFIIAALDHRNSWSNMYLSLEMIGYLLVLIGFYVVYKVFKENTFTAATIEVAKNQKVISSGPYALVRHPMYSGAFILLLGTPLALGTWWAFIPVTVLILVIVLRLLDEEKYLSKNLKGYKKYCQKVRYHILPYLW